MIYYPEKNFNGILIVLRESGDSEGTEEGSKTWFCELIDEKKTDGKSIDRKQRRYRNRFMQMLELCGENKLASTAYGNIKPLKGGKKLSEEYKMLSCEEKNKRLTDMLNECKPKVVFLIWDAFDAYAKAKGAELKQGIVYENGDKMMCFEELGVKFFSIKHPIRSARIVK